MNTSSTGTVHCIGRYSFIAPPEMKASGRSQSMYITNIATVPVRPADFKAFWKSRLAQQPAPRQIELLPAVQASWSARSATYPEILTIEAAKSVGDSVLVVDREADAGKEPVAESIVRDIFNAWALDTSHGFCVGYGAILLEPSVNEQARLSLEHSGSPGVKLRFQTKTVREPDLTTYADADEEKGLATRPGEKVTVLAERKRTAAALEGRELWISGAFRGEKPAVRFTWVYPGVGGNGATPSIRVVATAPEDKLDELKAIWETVLISLRPVPLAAGQAQ